MMSSTPKSFLHCSHARSISFAFTTSNFRARKNLPHTPAKQSKVNARQSHRNPASTPTTPPRAAIQDCNGGGCGM